MTKRVPKKPKPKKDNIKKANTFVDLMIAGGPYAKEIIPYIAHGTAAAGAGATGYAINKMRKLKKDRKNKKAGFMNGGAVMPNRGGNFKGIF